jgi:hypothetical protein
MKFLTRVLFGVDAQGQQNAKGYPAESGTVFKSASAYVHQAEYLMENFQRADEAYRIIRQVGISSTYYLCFGKAHIQAYSMDPFDKRCLMVYITNLMELGLKTELFYLGKYPCMNTVLLTKPLGHELTSSMPKSALSWFAVGCYYWVCKKNELAQNYLQKCIRIDKRFRNRCILLM